MERAVADFRRGWPVVISSTESSDSAFLCRSVELITDKDIKFLSDLTGNQVVLVLTGQRAAALILTSGPHAMNEAKPQDMRNLTVTLPLPPDIKARDMHGLCDPTSDDAAGPFAHLPVTPLENNVCLEAAIPLARQAHLLPAVLASKISAPSKDGGLADWARGQDLLYLSAEEILETMNEDSVALTRVASAKVPLAMAENTRISIFRPEDGGPEHYAIVIGDPKGDEAVLARIHSQCFTGDLLDSLRCDCGDQLRGALESISKSGSGVLLYLTQEGRGIGLVNKLRAYTLQDQGYDTFEANEQLGFDADERVYHVAAEMLHQLGFEKVRLMTNNPKKVEALTHYGIDVTERVSHSFPTNSHNEAYLQTKARRGGHIL